MEVEQLGDKRSSIQSRLYAHLIAELCTAEGDPKRGLFKTATTLYRCSQCNGLMTRDVDLKVPCKAGRVILTNTGEIFYRHERYNQKCLVPMDQNLPTHVFCSHQGCDMELD